MVLRGRRRAALGACAVDRFGATRWLCALAVTADGVWHLDCSDWDRLQDALPDETLPVWRVPVWGKPMHAGRAEELLRAVLCRDARGCEIRLATRMLRG